MAATVDTRGLATEYYVDFGPTPAYGGRTAGVAIPGAAAPTGIGATLTAVPYTPLKLPTTYSP